MKKIDISKVYFREVKYTSVYYESKYLGNIKQSEDIFTFEDGPRQFTCETFDEALTKLISIHNGMRARS